VGLTRSIAEHDGRELAISHTAFRLTAVNLRKVPNPDDGVVVSQGQKPGVGRERRATRAGVRAHEDSGAARGNVTEHDLSTGSGLDQHLSARGKREVPDVAVIGSNSRTLPTARDVPESDTVAHSP
jgi:hypothetical protein